MAEAELESHLFIFCKAFFLLLSHFPSFISTTNTSSNKLLACVVSPVNHWFGQINNLTCRPERTWAAASAPTCWQSWLFLGGCSPRSASAWKQEKEKTSAVKSKNQKRIQSNESKSVFFKRRDAKPARDLWTIKLLVTGLDLEVIPTLTNLTNNTYDIKTGVHNI